MPFDGIVLYTLTHELNKKLAGGRVDKIYQPERDEIHVTMRSLGQNHRLILSASASHPRVHLSTGHKENPMEAPLFCMLLRKHLQGGRIIEFSTDGFERIMTMHVEITTELGDIVSRFLVLELMGRHSNLILLNENKVIIDAIKHVDAQTNRVREVMPARQYMLPPAQNKQNILEFSSLKHPAAGRADKWLLDTFSGFSPYLCRELLNAAGMPQDISLADMSDAQNENLTKVLTDLRCSVSEGKTTPYIRWSDAQPPAGVEFHAFSFEAAPTDQLFSGVSEALDVFFSASDRSDRMKQKKADLHRTLQNALDRCIRKIGLQEEKLREASGKDTFRLYGDLLTSHLYALSDGIDRAVVANYFSENLEDIEIPLDSSISPQQNAALYYKKYAKAKSTETIVERQLDDSRNECAYLESVIILLEQAETPLEVDDLRKELGHEGYIRIAPTKGKRRKEPEAAPLTFVSSDGLMMYVGRNNRQNDKLTLKTASSNDIWLHTKNVPGSHVIVRKEQGEIPDSTLLEGAYLAAWYSKARNSSLVEVDYTQVRHIWKANGAKPGMVLYDHQKTIVITPDRSKLPESSK